MHPSKSSSLIVAGIDVGGRGKGFHAVALEAGAYLNRYNSCDPLEVAEWCRRIDARVIGVDAPCHWSSTGRARAAERELMKGGIWCFSTPTREVAKMHPKNHFDWMLNGAELFAKLLEAKYLLFDGVRWQTPPQMCFETFPHAITCALAGKIVPAKQKRAIRRALLIQANIDTSKLTNIDQIDAALCALTAHQFTLGNIKRYGDTKDGSIVVPGCPLTSSPETAETGANLYQCHEKIY